MDVQCCVRVAIASTMPMICFRQMAVMNTHGTGCTLSSAICANLVKGYKLTDAVRKAKAYISDALSDMLDLGKGSGPMNHAFDLKGRYSE